MLWNGVHDDDSTATFDLVLNSTMIVSNFVLGKKKKKKLIDFGLLAIGVFENDRVNKYWLHPLHFFFLIYRKLEWFVYFFLVFGFFYSPTDNYNAF